jgi:hypothetical protein
MTKHPQPRSDSRSTKRAIILRRLRDDRVDRPCGALSLELRYIWPGMRRLLIASGLLALPSVLALMLPIADASVRREPIHVSPSFGSPSAVFVVSFRAPQRAGRNGSSQRHDVITASAPRGAGDCIESIDVRAPSAPAGARVRVSLDSRNLGGSWCLGAYHGRIEELQDPACRPDKRCPSHAVMRGIVGRFTLHVGRGAQPSSTSGSSGTLPPGSSPSPSGTSPPSPSTSPTGGTDTTPPTFSGLQSAYYCTGGPVRPSETTPYTLTWQAATDDFTPSSAIVYDVFVAHTTGGEDFSHPTWTTPPGVTTYTTTNLPSEGTYFVVRARDEAGNDDQNKVEREGGNLCL